MTKRFVGIVLIATLLCITGWVLAQQSNDLVLFEATFDDGTIPENLEITGGETSVESGILTLTSEAPQLIGVMGETSTLTDYSIEIRIQIVNGEFWIQSRGSGSSYCGGYYLLVNPEKLTFNAAIGNEDCDFRIIESKEDVEFSGDFITLRLDTSGETVTAYSDDEMLFSFDDDSIPMGLPILSIIPGSSGTASVAIDSIRVLDLNPDAIATATAAVSTPVAVQPTDTPEITATATLVPPTNTVTATTQAPTNTASPDTASATPTIESTLNPIYATATAITEMNATTQAQIDGTWTAVAEQTVNAATTEPTSTPMSPTNTATATDTITPTIEVTDGPTSTITPTIITTDVPTGTPWPTALPPATATITPTLDPDRFMMPPAPESFGEATVESEQVISALRELGLIPDGGSMLFEEDFVGVSRVGDWFQPFPLQNPVKDMVLAAELTYYGSGFGATQSCQISMRVGRDERDIARTFLDVGLTTRGETYVSETIQTGGRSVMHNTASIGVGVGQPAHLLIIVINNQLTVYVNGGLQFENIEVVDRSGIVGLSISSTDANTRCEARQIWGYSLDN